MIAPTSTFTQHCTISKEENEIQASQLSNPNMLLLTKE